MSRTIVILDDNALALDGVVNNVDWARLGSPTLHTFSGAREALAWLTEHAADVVISDISMPGMSGIEAAKKMLAASPFLKVIFISAYKDFKYAQEALQLGALDYVEKPIDYQLLGDLVEKALEEGERERRNAELLSRSRPLVTERFFLELIRSSQDEARLRIGEYSDYLDLRVEGKRFLFLSIRILNQNAVKAALGAEGWQVQILTLTEDLEAMLDGFSFHYLLQELENIYLILGALPEEEPLSRRATALLKRLIAAQRNKLELCCGIGEEVADLSDINASFVSSQKALNYRFFAQKDIYDIAEFQNRETALGFPFDAFQEQVISLICSKDLEKLRLYLAEHTRNIFRHFQDKNTLLLSFFPLLHNIVDFMEEINVDVTETRAEIVDSLSRPDTFSSSESFFDWMYGICARLVEGIRYSISAYHTRLCNQTTRYIRANYQSQELCLDEIAAHVNISPAYLSMIFKKYEGQNISDVILQLRMEKAKNQLAYSSLPIKAISQNAGYANQYYFSAMFKKQTGLTPSQFRDRQRLDGKA